MSKTLDQAIAKARELPETDQEQVGSELNGYIDDLGNLRADLAEGIRSLDAGHGRRIDIEEVIARARPKYAGG